VKLPALHGFTRLRGRRWCCKTSKTPQEKLIVK
jgi:hypothetical protein